jgi:predicted DNA-binding transcriptional regulator AlpA
VADEYLDIPAVAQILGVEPATVSRYKYRDPTFPKPDIVLSGRAGWRRDVIEEWIATRPGQGAGGGRPPKRHRTEE